MGARFRFIHGNYGVWVKGETVPLEPGFVKSQDVIIKMRMG